MAKVKFKQGYIFVKDGYSQKNIPDLETALAEQAKCHACGCNSDLGYFTQINAETEELMLMWISGKGTDADPYAWHIAPQAEALVEVKLLKAYRCGTVETVPSNSASASISASVSPSASRSPSASSSASVSPSASRSPSASVSPSASASSTASASVSPSASASSSASASVSPSASSSLSVSPSTSRSPSASRSPSSSASPSA